MANIEIIGIDMAGNQQRKLWGDRAFGFDFHEKEILKRFPDLLKQTALKIMNAAKIVAPVLTGRYRASIHIQVGGQPASNKYTYKDDKGQSFDGSFSENPGEDEIFIGTNVVYAGAVERKHRTLEKAAREGQFYLNSKINNT